MAYGELNEAWDPVSRDREGFRAWMERHVLGTEDFAEHLRSIGEEVVR